MSRGSVRVNVGDKVIGVVEVPTGWVRESRYDRFNYQTNRYEHYDEPVKVEKYEETTVVRVTPQRTQFVTADGSRWASGGWQTGQQGPGSRFTYILTSLKTPAEVAADKIRENLKTQWNKACGRLWSWDKGDEAETIRRIEILSPILSADLVEKAHEAARKSYLETLHNTLRNNVESGDRETLETAIRAMGVKPQPFQSDRFYHTRTRYGYQSDDLPVPRSKVDGPEIDLPLFSTPAAVSDGPKLRPEYFSDL